MSQERWTLETENSYINYDANHFLHAWSGTNNIIKGIITGNKNEFQKIAIAMFVRDFDSKNNNRDNNALKILELLKFPKIEFFSDKIITNDSKMSISGEMNFHGIGIKKSLIPVVKYSAEPFHKCRHLLPSAVLLVLVLLLFFVAAPSPSLQPSSVA